jgi:dihydropteroate synthase
MAAGVAPERIQVDPGIGFGKTIAHNLELLRRLDEIVAIGFPVVVGTSRKSFLGRITGRDDPRQRLHGTIASNVMALERGARVFRVHDVAAVRDALAVAAATLRADGP